MPPTSSDPGPPRPAKVVNNLIRAIVVGAQDREWTAAEQALYRLLVDEWERAMRARVVEAA